MAWMNQWEIENLNDRFNDVDTPNLFRATQVLSRLAAWANQNSDGWVYWPKPARAASSLMGLLERKEQEQRRGNFEVTDLTNAELTKALSPIKAFLTRQGVAYEEVLV